MKYKFIKIALGAAIMSYSLYSCNNSSESTKPANKTTEESSTTEEIPAPAVQNSITYNANLATEDELHETGLSHEMVDQIIFNRPFNSMSELDTLLISVENRADLYNHLFIPFNLNTTSEEDFKMIPGVGDKMAHEFDEYRPYKNIKQFRKEIGKYVDEEEVARYENFVFVPIELNSASEEDILALPGLGKKMAHEFDEYRPYTNMAQFRKEIGKYVDDKELKRLERLVYLK